MKGKKLTVMEFINTSSIAHNNKYTYTKAIYKNNKTKVIITCPIHGDFEQVPKDHMKGLGCDQCSHSYVLTSEKFIEKSNYIHNNAYDYCNVKYVSSKVKVVITCKVHGTFEMTPNSHLAGQGCSKCANIKLSENNIKPLELVIQDFKQVHGNKFDYSKVEYVRSNQKIIIVCSIHGEFKQTSDDHLQGKGCPSCAVYGFDKNKPAYLYYLKITTEDNQVLYKIGVTNRTVDERFNLTDLSKIEIIKQKLYENGFEALEWETKLKQLYKEYQYKGPNILSSGNTELFTEDIVSMYYNDCVHIEEN